MKGTNEGVVFLRYEPGSNFDAGSAAMQRRNLPFHLGNVAHTSEQTTEKQGNPAGFDVFVWIDLVGREDRCAFVGVRA